MPCVGTLELGGACGFMKSSSFFLEITVRKMARVLNPFWEDRSSSENTACRNAGTLKSNRCHKTHDVCCTSFLISGKQEPQFVPQASCVCKRFNLSMGVRSSAI